jgi:hypothetical protein
MMLLHSLLIGLLLYVIMVFLMKQPARIAEDRSVLLGAIVLIYMILFGHGLPKRINRNIM